MIHEILVIYWAIMLAIVTVYIFDNWNQKKEREKLIKRIKERGLMDFESEKKKW